MVAASINTGEITVLQNNNFTQNEELELGITVMDNEFSSSATITINFNDPNEPVTSIADLVVGEGLKVFPIPTANELNVEFTDMDLRHAKWLLTDLTGKIMITTYEQLDNKSFKLDLSSLSNGVYLLMIAKDDETKTIRVTKK